MNSKTHKNLQINKKLHQRVKLLAAQQDTTITRLIEEAVKAFLKVRKK